MKATRLVLVRHGESAGSISGRNSQMSGWTDFPLSPLGERQAASLHPYFLASPPPAALYCSPLLRARQTARPIQESTGLELQIIKGLREINCGEVDGLPFPQVQERFTDLWAQNLRQENDDFRWPGGESYRELRERSLKTLDQIAARHPGELAIIITHCGLITQIMGAIRGIPPAQWEKFRPGNCSITRLEWGERPRLVSFDERDHLASVPKSLQPLAH